MPFENSIVSRRAVLGAGIGIAAAGAFAPRRGAAADRWEPVRKVCSEEVGKIGASLLVLTPERTVFAEPFGDAYLQIPTILASASMGLSAIAILALVDRGALDLDGALSKHLPEFSGDKGKITVRQCLSHQSGINDPGDLLVPSEIALTSSLADEVTLAASKPLMFKPGGKFLLGGMGYQAAGRAAEVAAGSDWPLIFASVVDGPLGVGFTYGETSDPRLAAGAAGTIASYGAVLSMLLNEGVANGARVLSPKMVKELRTNQAGHGLAATPVSAGIKTTGYGLGWWIERTDDKGLGTLINCAGSFGTFPWIDFERGYAAMVAMRDKEETGRKLAAKIRPLIEKALS